MSEGERVDPILELASNLKAASNKNFEEEVSMADSTDPNYFGL